MGMEPMDIIEKILYYTKKMARNRVICLSVLILIFLALCFYYNSNFFKHQEYSSTGTILTSYPQGHMVFVSGTVADTFNGGFYLNKYKEEKLVRFRVLSSENVSVGDKVEILGILGSNYKIKAIKIVVTPNWNYYYLILRSLAGFLIIILFLWKYWK